MSKHYHRIAVVMFAIVAGAAYLVGGASIEGLTAQLCVCTISSLFLLFLIWIAPKSFFEIIPKAFWISFGILAALFAIQLIPLPPQIWLNLPDRQILGDEIALLNSVTGWRPLSLSPYKTLTVYVSLAPALLSAFIVLTVRQKSLQFLIYIVVGLVLLSASWGLVQVFSGGDPSTYIWKFTNIGSPTGAFANVNHQATFMLVSFPLLAFLSHDYIGKGQTSEYGKTAKFLTAFLGLICFTCLVTTGSLAGYLIAFPVGILVYLLYYKKKAPFISQIVKFVSGFTLLGIIFVFIFTSPQLNGLGVTSFEDNPLSRFGVNSVSIEMLKSHWVAGSGAGSYEELYKSYESPETVSSTYIKHAHNDYLEFVVEFGAFGLIFLPLSFVAFCSKAYQSWFGKCRALPFNLNHRAMSIMILVFVFHSLVDYPLRNQILSIIFAVAVALLYKNPFVPSNEKHKKMDFHQSLVL